MARAATLKAPALPSLAADMRVLLDLVSRAPTAARVTAQVERMLGGWRDGLDPDAYAERCDTLLEGLTEAIEQMAEAAGDVDPASKAEARTAAAALETMRTVQSVVRDGALMVV